MWHMCPCVVPWNDMITCTKYMYTYQFTHQHAFLIWPCVQTTCRSRSPGTVWRGLIFFTTDRPHYPRMPPLSGDNHSWSGFGCALGHHATTFCACAHLMKTAVQYQLRAQGHSPLNILSPDPTCLVGPPGEVSASVYTMGLPGKVPLSRTFPGKRDLVWTRGVSNSLQLTQTKRLEVLVIQNLLRRQLLNCNDISNNRELEWG